MSSLTMMFLLATVQAGFACDPVFDHSGSLQPLSLVDAVVGDGQILRVGNHATASRGEIDSRPEAADMDADLDYYFDLHAQALSGGGGAGMKPWIELHPLGATAGTPELAATPAHSEAHGQSSGNKGEAPLPAARKACS